MVAAEHVRIFQPHKPPPTSQAGTSVEADETCMVDSNFMRLVTSTGGWRAKSVSEQLIRFRSEIKAEKIAN